MNSPKDGSWVYMWIAHYNDGTSLPQYDPYTLETHLFNEVQQDKLIKFGLYPFPADLAKKLREEKKFNARSNIFLPRYEVEITGNRRVIGALTTNFIKQTTYYTCPKCKNKFESKEVVRYKIGPLRSTLQCPRCGDRGYWYCTNCNKRYNHSDETDDFKCVDCGQRVKPKDIPKFITNTVIERWRIYKLGFQETINGVNKKTIMHIQENGDVELKDK